MKLVPKGKSFYCFTPPTWPSRTTTTTRTTTNNQALFTAVSSLIMLFQWAFYITKYFKRNYTNAYFSNTYFSFVSISLAYITIPKNKRKTKITWNKILTTTYILKETILELIILSSPRRPDPTHLHQLKTEKTFYNLTLSTVNSASINSTEMLCARYS